MGKLRDQFQRDLAIKGYSPQTRQAYLARVCDFVQHFDRPPTEVGREEISSYLQYLLCERNLSQSYLNQTYSALGGICFVPPGTISCGHVCGRRSVAGGHRLSDESVGLRPVLSRRGGL